MSNQEVSKEPGDETLELTDLEPGDQDQAKVHGGSAGSHGKGKVTRGGQKLKVDRSSSRPTAGRFASDGGLGTTRWITDGGDTNI